MKNYKIKIIEDYENTLKILFGDLLKNNIVDALLLPCNVSNSISYLLVQDIEKINSFSLQPIMLSNRAKHLQNISRLKSNKKIGALLYPCEIRAVIELIKLKMINKDNLFIIGIDCSGTKKLLGDENIRSSCNICENFYPENYDMSIAFFGINKEKEFFISTYDNIKTTLNLEECEEAEERKLEINKLKKIREENNKIQIGKFEEEILNLDMFLSKFSNCIKCYNCRRTCPVCYCKQCIFETNIFEHPPSYYEKLLNKKNAIKIPTETIMFHLTRLNHIATSCISCGMCSSSCPQNLPVFELFHTIGKKTQKLFEYMPGKSLEDELPISIFREDEFKEIGE